VYLQLRDGDLGLDRARATGSTGSRVLAPGRMHLDTVTACTPYTTYERVDILLLDS